LRRIYIATIIIVAIATVWGINYLHIGDPVQLNECKLTNDASLPYPFIQFTVSNQGAKNITAIRASVNEIDLPYTFGVSEENPLESRKTWDYHGYTAWYEPYSGVGGFNPNFETWYRAKVTLLLSDGSTKVYRKLGRYSDSHRASIATLGGFDNIGFRGASLLVSGSKGTLNLNFRNDWRVESSQTIKRLKLKLDEVVVWEEDVRVDFTKYFAVTVEIPFELESGVMYNVTLIAYSEEGNVSTYTESAICQKYEIG
jgi:hypothetical protein